jgi:hypothetical protein
VTRTQADVIAKIIDHYCCPTNSLSLRDAYRDVGGRATQDAKAERVGVRGSNKGNWLISYPLILSFSLREKGRSVLSAAIDFHVGSFA